MSASKVEALEKVLQGLITKFFPDFVIEGVYKCNHQLRSHASGELSSLLEARFWELSVDYFALVSNSNSKNDIVIVNQAKNALGLTELGEFHTYSKVVKPLFALQVAENGLSRDLYNLLLRPEVSHRLLNYNNRKIVVYAGASLDTDFSLDFLFPPLDLA